MASPRSLVRRRGCVVNWRLTGPVVSAVLALRDARWLDSVTVSQCAEDALRRALAMDAPR